MNKGEKHPMPRVNTIPRRSTIHGHRGAQRQQYLVVRKLNITDETFLKPSGPASIQVDEHACTDKPTEK